MYLLRKKKSQLRYRAITFDISLKTKYKRISTKYHKVGIEILSYCENKSQTVFLNFKYCILTDRNWEKQ